MPLNIVELPVNQTVGVDFERSAVGLERRLIGENTQGAQEWRRGQKNTCKNNPCSEL